VIEDHAASARRTLVDCSDEVGHGLNTILFGAFAQRAGEPPMSSREPDAQVDSNTAQIRLWPCP
jgi:hypothetical protein